MSDKLPSESETNPDSITHKEKTLVALAGVKHAMHLGEECLEFREALKNFHVEANDTHLPFTPVDHLTVHNAWNAVCREALDVIWLVHHLGIAKAFAVTVHRADCCNQTLDITLRSERKYYTDPDVSNAGDEYRTVLRDVLPYRTVLAVDRAIEVLELMKDNGALQELYSDWVATQVDRGRARSSYHPEINAFLHLVQRGWQRTFGSERPQPSRPSEWDLYDQLLESTSGPALKEVLQHLDKRPRQQWVVDHWGFVQRRGDAS